MTSRALKIVQEGIVEPHERSLFRFLAIGELSCEALNAERLSREAQPHAELLSWDPRGHDKRRRIAYPFTEPIVMYICLGLYIVPSAAVEPLRPLPFPPQPQHR
jgi:hypothetical protein